MKVRFVLPNSWGYCHEASVEMYVDIVPRIGETVWIDNTELLNALDSVGKEPECCDGMDMYDSDCLTVVDIRHDYTPSDFGVYVVLAFNREEYI